MENAAQPSYYEKTLNELLDKIRALDNDIPYTKLEDFEILLAAPYSLMDGSDFTNMQMVDPAGNAASRSKIDEDLKSFGIVDEETAMQVISRGCLRGTHWQYAQFMMYDQGNFNIEVEKMTEKGRESFLKCRDFTQNFKNVVGKHGYFGWDMALSAKLIRECVYDDFFNEPSAREMFGDLTKPLLKNFDNWADYAVSFIAGGAYSAYKNSGFDELEARKSFDYLVKKCDQLFTDERVNVWKVYHWYTKKEYFPMLDKDNLEPLVKGELGSKGSFVSDRVSVDGVLPCMIYREKPFKNFPDSGWRFFAGDESKEYSSDRDNSNIFTLNVVANFDPTIVPLLDAEVGTVYIRKEGGEFIKSRLDMKDMQEDK
ncbi:MAG: DUF2185 domain-containing protein [Eubacteriales bacterium]|nr:DUF2185 domain-containing protein [Eubacteriales bacterium]